jgi:predicted kinase
MAGRLVIICGLPASGKTTRAKLLETQLAAVRLSPDEWMAALAIDVYDETARTRIEALQWQLAQRLLALRGTVIIEWGTWARSERDTLRLGARALGANVELHYLAATLDILFERAQRRGLENPPISRSDFDRFARLLQPPTAEEWALFDPPTILQCGEHPHVDAR